MLRNMALFVIVLMLMFKHIFFQRKQNMTTCHHKVVSPAIRISIFSQITNYITKQHRAECESSAMQHKLNYVEELRYTSKSYKNNTHKTQVREYFSNS
jgi:hypothetical protein